MLHENIEGADPEILIANKEKPLDIEKQRYGATGTNIARPYFNSDRHTNDYNDVSVIVGNPQGIRSNFLRTTRAKSVAVQQRPRSAIYLNIGTSLVFLNIILLVNFYKVFIWYELTLFMFIKNQINFKQCLTFIS